MVSKVCRQTMIYMVTYTHVHSTPGPRLHSQPQGVTVLWPVVIAPTHGGTAGLSYIPRWIARSEDGSPIQIVTELDVEQLH